MKKFKEKLKNVPWYIFLAIIVAISVISVIFYIFDFGFSIINLLNDIFVAVGDGNWIAGVLGTLAVLVGLINAVRGVFAEPPKKFYKLPEWAQTLIMGLSLIGTIWFLIVFFDKLV